MDPQNSNARYGLAQMYIAQGNISKAEDELRIFEEQKEFEGRKVALLRAVELEPRNPEPAFLLAKFYLEYQRLEEAVEILERIVSISPNFTKALSLLKQLSKPN